MKHQSCSTRGLNICIKDRHSTVSSNKQLSSIR